MIDRRAFLAGIGGFIATPLAAEAQPNKVFKIGFLRGAGTGRAFNAFREALNQHGYMEGRRVTYQVGLAGSDNVQFPALARDLIGARVDIIVAASTPAALAAKSVTASIPVVFFGVGDPIGTGLVLSLARPGGNVTGVSQATSEGLPGKRLEILKELAPKASRVAVIWVATNQTNRVAVASLETATKALRMTMQSLGVNTADDITAAFSVIRERRADSLSVLPDVLTFGELQRIIDFAAENRLPAVYAFREFVEAGGLISYGIDLLAASRTAASLVVKVLNGARVSELPVEQATKYETVINLKTAKALGLTIPPSLLLRADQVLE